MKAYVPWTYRFLRYLWSFKLTMTGRFVAAAMCVASLGTVSVVIPVYQVFFVASGLLVTALVLGIATRTPVKLVGNFPERTTAGTTTELKYRLVNRGRHSVLDVSLEMPYRHSAFRVEPASGCIPVLKAGESGTLAVELTARRRGVHSSPALMAVSTFPFGLVRTALGQHRVGKLTILPAFHPIRELDVPLSTRYQPGGIALSSQIGESPEYIGNREYVPGDNTRRLDHRSWARLGRPVVREYQEEYFCKIALILDTYVPARRKVGADGFPELEAAISVTAAIVDVLSRGEYVIDLFAAGPELHVFRSGRHTAPFDYVLDLLAGVAACRRNPFDELTPAVQDQAESVSTTICVFLNWDEDRERLCQAMVEAGSRLKVILVHDGTAESPPVFGHFDDFVQLSVEDIRRGEFESL